MCLELFETSFVPARDLVVTLGQNSDWVEDLVEQRTSDLVIE